MKFCKFYSKIFNNDVKFGQLVAKYEINLSRLSCDYNKLEAGELFNIWVETVLQKYPDGLVDIVWFVTLNDKPFKPEFMPYQVGWAGEDNFLTYFSHPVDIETGELVDWHSLSVVAPQWEKGCDGFIEFVTGWVPSVLQSQVSIEFLIRAAESNGYQI